MSGLARKLTSAAVVAGLTLVPAGAFATTPAPAAAPAAAPAVSTAAPGNPWLTLSAMTSTSSSAAATAAAQDYDGEGMGMPPIVPLAIILATFAVGIWIAVKDDEDLDIELSPD